MKHLELGPRGNERPFYWVQWDASSATVAPTGWYQWQRERGLVYLGDTILAGSVSTPHPSKDEAPETLEKFQKRSVKQ